MTPNREQVMAALNAVSRDYVVDLVRATDAVMALLAGESIAQPDPSEIGIPDVQEAHRQMAVNAAQWDSTYAEVAAEMARLREENGRLRTALRLSEVALADWERSYPAVASGEGTAPQPATGEDSGPRGACQLKGMAFGAPSGFRCLHPATVWVERRRKEPNDPHRDDVVALCEGHVGTANAYGWKRSAAPQVPAEALQRKVGAWHRQRFPTASASDIVMKTQSELGEVADAVLGVELGGKGVVAEEAADVVLALMALVDVHVGADLLSLVAAKLAELVRVVAADGAPQEGDERG